jgi:hypothetical protein
MFPGWSKGVFSLCVIQSLIYVTYDFQLRLNLAQKEVDELFK